MPHNKTRFENVKYRRDRIVGNILKIKCIPYNNFVDITKYHRFIINNHNFGVKTGKHEFNIYILEQD